METQDYIQIAIASASFISILISLLAMSKTKQTEQAKECRVLHNKIHDSEIVDTEIKGEIASLRKEVNSVCKKLDLVLEKIL